MSHNINGFIGPTDELNRLAGFVKGAVVVPLLVPGLSLIPRPPYGVPLRVKGSDVEISGGIASDSSWYDLGQQARVRIAHVETSYFGGSGDQSAAVWDGGKKFFKSGKQDSINQALAILGVVKDKGVDEFDTVGLGLYRANEDWENSFKVNPQVTMGIYCPKIQSNDTRTVIVKMVTFDQMRDDYLMTKSRIVNVCGCLFYATFADQTLVEFVMTTEKVRVSIKEGECLYVHPEQQDMRTESAVLHVSDEKQFQSTFVDVEKWTSDSGMYEFHPHKGVPVVTVGRMCAICGNVNKPDHECLKPYTPTEQDLRDLKELTTRVYLQHKEKPSDSIT